MWRYPSSKEERHALAQVEEAYTPSPKYGILFPSLNKWVDCMLKGSILERSLVHDIHIPTSSSLSSYDVGFGC